MLQRIIYIILVLNFNLYSDGLIIAEYNVTSFFSAISSQLAELRTNQEIQRHLIDGLDKNNQEKLLNGLIKAIEFRTEQEKLNKTELYLEIKSLKTNLEQFKTFLDKQEETLAAVVNKTELQTLKSDIQNLKTAQDKLIAEQIKVTNGYKTWFQPRNCAEAKISRNFDIVVPNFSSQAFTVDCDAYTKGGGWTIILRRLDGSVNFNRNWEQYKNGFGDLSGEFFLGLDKIHALTTERNQELLVVLEDFEGNSKFETYEEFGIGDEHEQYVLYKLGSAAGTAGDSFSYHRHMKFTTYDRDNDRWKENNCAVERTGGWWHDGLGPCQESQLTGTYKNNDYSNGVNWAAFRGVHYSLKKAIMMIRTKK